MRILVTGITGAIGSRLAPQLLAAGHDVHALTRQPDAAQLSNVPEGIRLLTGDAVSGIGLPRALEGVDVAYYLIHSMEPGPDGDFTARERQAAENFAHAATKAGVDRIVYLGGLVPDGAPSNHLASRLAVEQVLLDAAPNSIALRASIVIGARSRSFRFLVRLIERMPVLLVPAWRDHRTAPVDERDVITCLVRAASATGPSPLSLDVVGPEIVTYGELIARIRDHLLLNRPLIGIPKLTLTPVASRVSALVAGEHHALIGPLMQGLNGDLLPRAELAADMFGVRLHSLDAAIERALRDWEQDEALRAR
jgi:uncharacterized protein YbjT (DUF2867 family)